MASGGTAITDSDFFALLIAVDGYLPNSMPDGSTYRHLGGCVRDVSMVEGFLKQRIGLRDDHLVVLKASGGGEEPPEPAEQWPTYDNMVAAFRRVKDRARPGDRVHVHYSGHGGRVATWFPERKGDGGYDEALVPTDIGTGEGQYLRDVELAKLLGEMVDKGLRVAVVLDCCHSGGMTRGRATARRRGLSGATRVDATPQPGESRVAPRAELAALLEENRSRNVTLGSGWLPEPAGYVLMAACRPSEYAHEDVFDGGGERNGALTYWLLEALGDLGPGLSYKLLHDRVLARVHGRFARQTPQLQGEGDWQVFGSRRVAPHYAVPVMRVEAAARRLLLGAGQAHGLRRKARLAVFAHGTTDFTAADRRKAVVEVVELGAAESWAAVPPPFDAGAVEPGDPAVLVGAGAVRLVRSVGLVRRDALPAAIDQDAALSAVARALPGNGWLELAASGDEIDDQVAVNDRGHYEIWDRGGDAVPLRPPVAIGDRGAGERLVRRLVHLCRYRATRELRNHDPTSPLARKLVVDLAGRQGDYDPADPPAPEPFEDPGGTPVLAPSEWTFLRVRNDSDRILNVTVLDLQPDWGISQVWPAGAGDHFVALDPGAEQLLPLQASLPPGHARCTDLLKVFATVGTTSFRWLELPALDRPTTRSAAVAQRLPADPLEEMLAAVTADRPPARHLHPAARPTGEWITGEVEVRVEA